MSDEIGVAVVGCGYWGPNLIRNFYSLRHCRVTMIADLSEERLAHMGLLYQNVRTTTRFENVLDDADTAAVVIATPVQLHYEMAKRSLEAGKHTLIEKPMARSSAECEELIRIAEEKDLALMVGHTFLFSTPVKRIKEIIQGGEVGEIFYVSSLRLNLGLFQSHINVTWDLAPHDLSILLYLLDSLPTRVNCQGKAHVRPGIEDVTNMSLDFSGNCFATVQNSWLEPNKVRRMTIVGSRRMIVYDDTEPLEKIKIYDKRVEAPRHYDTFGEFHYSYHYGDLFVPHLDQEEPLRVQCRHFLDCVRGDCEPVSDGRSAIKVVKVLEAATESLRAGGNQVMLDWSSLP